MIAAVAVVVVVAALSVMLVVNEAVALVATTAIVVVAAFVELVVAVGAVSLSRPVLPCSCRYRDWRCSVEGDGAVVEGGSYPS